MNRRREERPGYDGAESAGDEPLERAAERVARQSLQAFGEMVDAEQEEAEPTQDRLWRWWHSWTAFTGFHNCCFFFPLPVPR